MGLISAIILVLFSIVAGNGKAYAIQYFFIERPGLGMRLSFEQDRETRDGPFLEGKEIISTRYTEELNIATRGWVYHPALLQYSLTLSPEWDQSRTNLADDSVRTSEAFLQGYDAEFKILQFKPYPLTLHGNRVMSTRRNNFAEKSIIQDDLIEARLDLIYTGINSSLKVLQRESEQTGFFDLDEDERRAELSIRLNSKSSITLLNGSYKDMSTTTPTVLLDTNSFITTLSNTLSAKNVSLNSRLNYNETDQSSLRRRNYSFEETLDINHRPNLRTYYHILYNKYNDFDKVSARADRSERKAVDFSLSHLLYENLSTSIQANSSQNRSRAGRVTDYGVNINWGYSRSIPSGRLVINTGYNYFLLDSKVLENTDNSVLVQDESVTLTDGVITFLANEDVVNDTIRVTQLGSSSGYGLLYSEGTDYEISFIDRQVRIIRNPLGAIADGQSVFVEYRFISSPAFDYSLFSQRYGIRLKLWSSLDIYYQSNLSKQEFIGGLPPEDFEFADDSTHLAGIEYNWKWSTTAFEWEDRYTKNAPLERWIVKETIRFRSSDKISFSLLNSYRKSMFKGSDITQEFFLSSSSVNWLLPDSSHLQVSGSWSKLTNRTQNLTNSRISSLYQRRFRIWEFNIEYEFDKIKEKGENDQDFTSHYILVELIRKFF